MKNDNRYTENRNLTQWLRPSGDKSTIRVPVTPEAAAILDEAVAAGFTYAVEWIGNAYAFYISDDSLEMDVVTDVITGETSEQQRGALSRVITRNPLRVLLDKQQRMVEMRSALDE